MSIDIQAELAALPLANRGSDVDSPQRGDAIPFSEAVLKLARQQFRTNQNIGHSLETMAATLAEANEQAQEHRREALRLQDDAATTRLRLVEALDALDDLLAISRQRAEPFWEARLERLSFRFAHLLSVLGVTELPGAGSAFDEHVHDVVETTTASDGVAPYTVVEVIKRGYRYDGRVLRRADVITTLGEGA